MALQALTEPQLPPKRNVRSKVFTTVACGLADASGKGFGSTVTIDGSLFWRSGQWKEFYEYKSSNRREFENIVIALEEYYSNTGIHNVELFMFTYNMVSENEFYRGTSRSPILFELVLPLRLLEMHGGWKLHVIHISGKRMIQKGTDGLSRGDMMSGVMGGVEMLSFVPLGKGADESSGSLNHWVHTWWKSYSPAKWLTSEGWFYLLARQGWFVWCPPPAIADAVLEQMYKAQQKRPQTSAHLFVCP
jgi:hypothetical protein